MLKSKMFLVPPPHPLQEVLICIELKSSKNTVKKSHGNKSVGKIYHEGKELNLFFEEYFSHEMKTVKELVILSKQPSQNSINLWNFQPGIQLNLIREKPSSVHIGPGVLCV